MTPKPKPAIGEYLKVWLPGERPWVTVLSHTENGVMGEIQNKLFAEYSEHEKARWTKDNFGTVEALPQLHNYKKGDIVEFAFTEWEAPAYPGEKFYDWQPVSEPKDITHITDIMPDDDFREE